MSYLVKIDSQIVDLFPNQDITISTEYYDTQNPDSIKIPFTFETNIPYTTRNKTILSYNHLTSIASLSYQSYDYEIYDGDDLISSGKARVESAVVNSTESYFTIAFSDKVSEFSKSLRELTFADIYNDAFSTQVRTLSTYLSSNQSYDGRDIEIPFIDMDNIQKSSGYESRVFTTYAGDAKRFGLMPALKITNFFERVFNALGYTYNSKFIDGTASWNATNLYMLYPTFLSSAPASKRESFLFMHPYAVPYNSDLTGLGVVNESIGGLAYNFNVSDIDNYYLSVRETYEPHGPTNYDAAGEALINYEFGDQLRTNDGVTQYGDEKIGFVSFGSAFDAKIEFQGTTVNVFGLRYCIAASEYEYSGTFYQGPIPTVVDITSINDAKFTPYVYIYESYQTSDEPTYKIPMLDASGNVIELTPIGSALPTNPIDFTPAGVPLKNSVLAFPTFSAKLSETETYFINGGSRYSVAFGLEMTSGSLIVDHYTSALNTLSPTVPFDYILATSQQLTRLGIIKARVHGYDWSDLPIVVDNAGNLPATCPNDVFSFKESILNNTEFTVYNVFIDLMKRFGLNLVFDYTSVTPEFILDNLNDVRLVTLAMDNYVDDLKPYEVSGPSQPFKTLSLLNQKKSGIYDYLKSELAVGSYFGDLNADGTGELKIEFISSLINRNNKSICKDETFIDPIEIANGLVSVQETGSITNEIPEYTDVGLRIFYLRDPNYTTTLRYPVFRHYNDYGQVIDQLVYKPFGPYFLQGYPENNLSGTNELDLYYQLDNGTTTDSFNYLLDTERFTASNNVKMSFYAAIPGSWFTNGYIFSRKFKFNKTNESFIISSISDARLYNRYMYGKLEIIFVD